MAVSEDTAATIAAMKQNAIDTAALQRATSDSTLKGLAATNASQVAITLAKAGNESVKTAGNATSDAARLR
jgi:hypothetical protein